MLFSGRRNFRVADDAVSPGFRRIVDDRVAPRLAVIAIHEGRALALRL